MRVPKGSSNRSFALVMGLAIGCLGVATSARAEMLVSELADTTHVASSGLELAPITSVTPLGAGVKNLAEPTAADGLALISLFVLPPPTDPSPTTPVSSTPTPTSGGNPTGDPGNGNTGPTVSNAPEPATMITGLLGAGLVGVFRLARRKVEPEVA